MPHDSVHRELSGGLKFANRRFGFCAEQSVRAAGGEALSRQLVLHPFYVVSVVPFFQCPRGYGEEGAAEGGDRGNLAVAVVDGEVAACPGVHMDKASVRVLDNPFKACGLGAAGQEVKRQTLTPNVGGHPLGVVAIAGTADIFVVGRAAISGVDMDRLSGLVAEFLQALHQRGIHRKGGAVFSAPAHEFTGAEIFGQALRFCARVLIGCHRHIISPFVHTHWQQWFLGPGLFFSLQFPEAFRKPPVAHRYSVRWSRRGASKRIRGRRRGVALPRFGGGGFDCPVCVSAVRRSRSGAWKCRNEEREK